MDAPSPPPLPPRFAAWFTARGWRPHGHQLALIAAHAAGEDALLVAPTGGGKTLAGFLPSLIELEGGGGKGLHTLYVSPLKALTTDIARNLDAPVAGMGLPVRVEARTGDTSASRRARQRKKPPDLLLTTPESLALLLAYPDSAELFRPLRRVIVDEVHALAGTKRGDLLSLGLAALRGLAPDARFVGLSATVADPPALLAFLAPRGRPARVVRAEPGPPPEIALLPARARMPWAGHAGLYALPEVMAAIRDHGTTLVFVNTRASAELVFQALWRLNDGNLAIALHHGSLSAEQRRRTEAAMAGGHLRAVVATSSLDLGIDWGAVDLVIQMGAPKGTARLLQRVGRANHRLDAPSRALLVPGGRFEVLECLAAVEAIEDGAVDGAPEHPGGLDVLAQHVLGRACAGPFDAGALFVEVKGSGAYAGLSRADFDAVLRFVADGGYVLRAYERFRRLVTGDDGLYRLADLKLARQWRMNVGTIVEAPTLKVRMRGRRGGDLGRVEEHFVQFLTPGDSFLFAGLLLRFEGIRETVVEVTRARAGGEPKVPSYVGGRLPLSTRLAARVRDLLADPAAWGRLPSPVRSWLALQAERSALPRSDELLVETFPRGDRHYLVAYPFAGRNAHQTLGMLLTRRMERAGLRPQGFVASDYALGVWSARPARDVDDLLGVDMLGDDLEEWMAESAMLKRTFRTVAVIAGLIERKHPGAEKTGRQVTINADLIYDVLRKHEPDHVLLRATRAEAAKGLTDVRRLADLLESVRGRVRHVRSPRVTPLALPVLLEVGRERVADSAAEEELLHELAVDLIDEAEAAALFGGEAA